MKKFIREQLAKDEKLLHHSAIIMAGSFIANALNYLYQLFMGRMLGPEDFGVLGALFALMYVATFSLGTIRVVITQFTAQYMTANHPEKVKTLLKQSTYTFLGIGGIAALIFILISPWLANFLNIGQISLFYAISLYLFLSIMSPIPLGVLYGLQYFATLTGLNVGAALLKLLSGILLVLMGYAVFGAVYALNISQAIIVLISFLLLWKFWVQKGEPIKRREIFVYSIPVLIALTVFNFFINLDVLLVKHFFPPTEAGYYAASSLLAKIILFASSSFLIVMFPKVAANHEKKKESSKMLKSTLFYTAVISLGIVAIYFVAPTFITTMLFGRAYKIAPYVGIFGLVGAVYSLSNVFVTYNLAVNRTWFVYALIPLLAVQVIGIALFHATLMEVIRVLLIVNILTLMLMLFITRKELGFTGQPLQAPQ